MRKWVEKGEIYTSNLVKFWGNNGKISNLLEETSALTKTSTA